MLLIGGAVAAIAAIAIIAVAAFSGSDDPVATFIDLPTVEASAVANDIDDEVVVAVAPTATTAPEPTVAPELAATPLPEPTALPSPTAVPTATPLPFPPETRRSQLNTIALVGATYEVGYDTLNYDPVIGGAGTHHLHFHWDIYPPDTVGTKAATQNPWTIWDTRGDGALVFDQFGPGTAPAGATAICAVVADSAHAIDNIELATDTVSCIDLP